MIGEDILAEIDLTLDQLITNAEAMCDISLNALSETEVDAFQKTQDSLLAHLIHMDKMFEQNRKSLKIQNKKSARFEIQQKLLEFQKLNESFVSNISTNIDLIRFEKKPRKPKKPNLRRRAKKPLKQNLK